MISNKEIKNYHEHLQKHINSLEETHNYPSILYRSILSGKYDVNQIKAIDKRVFNSDWITVVESYFPSIINIVSKYKVSLKYDESIVPIEKAKKTDSQSVKHLAAHTHYIKKYNTKDGIMPEKIMMKTSEIDISIYENRFVKGVIDQLFVFVNDRYNQMINQDDATASEILNIDTKFELNNQSYDIKLNLSSRKKIEEIEIHKYNSDILQRTVDLLETIQGFQDTTFMKELHDCIEVIPPIKKTHILSKNIDYNNAYLLWFYLNELKDINYEIITEKEDVLISRVYQKSILQNLMSFTSSFLVNQINIEEDYKYINIPSNIGLVDSQIEGIKDIYNRSELLLSYFQESYTSEGFFEHSLRKMIEDVFNDLFIIVNKFFDYSNKLDEEIFSELIKRPNDDILAEAKERLKTTQILTELVDKFFTESIQQESNLIKKINKIVTKMHKNELNEHEISHQNIRRKYILQKELEMIEIDKTKHDEIRKDILSQKQTIRAKRKELEYLEKKTLSDLISELNIKQEKEMKAIKESFVNQESQIHKKHQTKLKEMQTKIEKELKKAIVSIKSTTLKKVTQKQDNLQLKIDRAKEQYSTSSESKLLAEINQYEQAFIVIKEKFKLEHEQYLIHIEKQKNDLEKRYQKELASLNRKIDKKISKTTK